MDFEADTWASPALQPPTHDNTVPRKGRRPSRYDSFISLDDLDATSRHRQSITERRSRYDWTNTGRDLPDASVQPPRITLTSPQKSTPGPITTRPVIRNPIRGHTSTNSVSHDDTEPFLGPAADISALPANSEESPPRSRSVRFHFGPHHPEVPGSQNAIPRKLLGASPMPAENTLSTANLLAPKQPDGSSYASHGSEAPRYQNSIRQAEAPSRTRSFLSRLAHRRSSSRLSTGEGYLVLNELDPIDEGEAALVDLSTLGGGTLDFRRISVPPDSGTGRSDDDPRGRMSNFAEAEVVINQPIASAASEQPSQSSRHENTSHIARANTIRKIGQHFAEREQVIVAVREQSPTEESPTVDLSTLEGTKRMSTETVDSSLSKSTTFHPNKRSYFYPADPEQPNWRPFSMRRPFIILLILLSLGLAGVQEWLFQKSQALEKKHHALIAFNKVAEVSLGAFFCWKYLPTLVFVSYGVLWQITDFETKRLEPYYQLSQPHGSIASASLNLDYLSLWAFFVPIKALTYRHWAVFWGSTASLFATTVAPSLQNPSVIFVSNPRCPLDTCPEKESRYFVHVHPVWSRLLSSSLIVVAAAGILLYIQLERKSGLLSDPKGIAGIASMATKSHILTDFQGMDEARQNEIHKRLKHHRYILYKSTIWQGEYIKHSKPDLYAERRVENPHPLILRLVAGVPFIIFLVACLALIPVINFTPVNVVATTLPWLLVLIATLIKQLWVTLEFAIRTIEPFYILSKGNALPQDTLTLDYRGTPYGLLPFQALRKKHYLVALAGVGSVLLDILTVAVSSFSVNGKGFIHVKGGLTSLGDQTFHSFWISISLSLVILLFLIVSATLIYMRRSYPFLPREPSTIASVLAFIHQSRMLDDFNDTERLNSRQMEALLVTRAKRQDKRYGLGWFKGRDGRPHCAVDEEPMLSRYKHGVSYIRARAPWEEI